MEFLDILLEINCIFGMAALHVLGPPISCHISITGPPDQVDTVGTVDLISYRRSNSDETELGGTS